MWTANIQSHFVIFFRVPLSRKSTENKVRHIYTFLCNLWQYPQHFRYTLVAQE
jgi:hypothetical protein